MGSRCRIFFGVAAGEGVSCSGSVSEADVPEPSSNAAATGRFLSEDLHGIHLRGVISAEESESSAEELSDFAEV